MPLPLLAKIHLSLRRFRKMGKKAVITVKLVDESLVSSNDAIAQEIFRWLHDALPALWVKEVDCVHVHGHANAAR